MMNNSIFYIMVLLLSFSCGSKADVSVHTRIEQYEDSIFQWGGGLGTVEEINAFADRYIKTLTEAYKEEPENKKTPEYLDRIHMWYATKGEPNQAVKWASLLLDKYPGYENREMLLESIAAMYDGEITPRDSVKVRNYYSQLLKEFPTMDKEKKEGILRRLEFNSLSFEEYLLKQTNKEEELLP